MAQTFQFQSPVDCSTKANFIGWAGDQNFAGNPAGISNAFKQATFGFVQTTDGGQATWADISKTLSSITGNGTIWTGTTSTAHGFRAGRVVTLAGTTHFNGNFVLLSASGTTFTITNATQSGVTDSIGGMTSTIKGITQTANVLAPNNTTQQTIANAAYPTLWRGIYNAGTTYAIGDVVWFSDATIFQVFVSISAANTGNTPAGGTGDTKWQTYNYEIFKSNDGLTQIFVKVEYGRCATAFSTATNVPAMALTIGTGSDGNSKLTGNVTFRELVGATGATANTTAFECDAQSPGNGSAMSCLMWRGATSGNQAFYFAFERSKDQTGADTSTYISYIAGYGSNSAAGAWRQNTLMLTGANPVAIAQVQATFGNPGTSWGVQSIQQNSLTTWIAFTQTAVAPIFPMLGYFGNPMLGTAMMQQADAGTDGTTITIYMYGASHVFLITKATWVKSMVAAAGTTACLAIRWDA